MPTVTLYGNVCRVRAMLDAIGAQEALESFGTGAPRARLAGPKAVAAFERERLPLAHRRNAAEGKLRPAEHAAWVAWRIDGPSGRSAAYAMLTDLPDKAERSPLTAG